MKIIRATNPQATLELLAPYLLTDEDFETVEDMRAQLFSLMVEDPEGCCVLIIIDEDKVKGFVFGVVEEGRKFSFIIQTWVDNTCSPKVGKDLFRMFEAWTRLRGKTEIQAETIRGGGALQRRYKFEKVSTIIRYRLKDEDDDYEESIEDNTHEIDEVNEEGSTEQVSEISADGAGSESESEIRRPAGLSRATFPSTKPGFTGVKTSTESV